MASIVYECRRTVVWVKQVFKDN